MPFKEQTNITKKKKHQSMKFNRTLCCCHVCIFIMIYDTHMLKYINFFFAYFADVSKVHRNGVYLMILWLFNPWYNAYVQSYTYVLFCFQIIKFGSLQNWAPEIILFKTFPGSFYGKKTKKTLPVQLFFKQNCTIIQHNPFERNVVIVSGFDEFDNPVD